jgi:hypothetical protein
LSRRIIQLREGREVERNEESNPSTGFVRHGYAADRYGA